MQTGYSREKEPLQFDPEIEKIARRNRVAQKPILNQTPEFIAPKEETMSNRNRRDPNVYQPHDQEQPIPQNHNVNRDRNRTMFNQRNANRNPRNMDDNLSIRSALVNRQRHNDLREERPEIDRARARVENWHIGDDFGYDSEDEEERRDEQGDLAQQFLDEYYTPQRTTEARNNIRNLQQITGETFYKSFQRFKRLLRTCPHHGIVLWELIKAFYDSLSDDDVRDLQATTNGSFLANDENEDWGHLERHASNSKRKAQSNRMSKRSVVKAFESHGSEDRMDRLEKNMDRLLVAGVQGAEKSGKTYPVCEGCGELGHEVASCGVVQDEEIEEEEEVNYVQGERKYNNMNSNTYHPGLRNHPNFSYGNPNTQQNPNFQGSSQKTGYQSNQKQYGNSSGSGQRYQKSYQQGQGSSSGNKEESLKDVMELLKQVKADQETQNKALNQRLELQEINR
ncbi:uncharacterized protein LOC143617677 [Bidens hawaiensis]|uniref:uncharacterized protein LOC143617677 n=1 Tax=Bidens hawaiensis TaxID=980011 RepID=UPI00404B5EBF